MMLAPVALIAAAIVCYQVYFWWARPHNDAFKVLPWVGFPKGPFARLRGIFVIENLEAVMHEAYVKYGLHGHAFVAASFLWPARVVLPPSMLPWILAQPDDVLSFATAVNRTLCFEVTSLDTLVMDQPSHPTVVRGPLTRSLAWTPKPMSEEIQTSFERVWGVPSEWKKIKLFETLLSVTAHVTNRIFLHSEPNLDEDFLEATIAFANSLALCGTLLRPLPAWLRRSTSWLSLISHRRHFRKILHYLEPMIERRKEILLQSTEAPEKKIGEPDDLLYWLVQNAHAHQDPREWSNSLIAKRYVIVMFATLHTTTWTLTNLFLDLLSADPKHDLIETLRTEVLNVSKTNANQWSKASLAQLDHMDSALRESMRLRTMFPFSIQRVVVSKGGVELPSGINVPQGTAVLISGGEIMRDNANYPNGSQYEPFRFSKEMSSASSQPGDTAAARGPSYIPKAAHSMGQRRNAVTVDNTFFSFGGGRNACPGRFFVTQMIKLILSHLLLEYEMAPLPKRPPEIWIGSEKRPDLDATISLRQMRS